MKRGARTILVVILKKRNFNLVIDYNEDNNLIKSSVVNTEIEHCSLKCGSLDQIGRFNFDASAKYATSFESEILKENSLINLKYSDLSINITFSLRDLIAELKSIPDFFDNSSLYLCNSINAKSGANNLKENLENRELATLFGLDNANKILLSFTNFILDYNRFSFSSRSATPLFTLRPISIHQSANPLSFSCLSLFSICSFQANCLAFDSMQALTNPDQLISGKLFILFLTSSGIDKVIDTILVVKKHKYVELFKPLDLMMVSNKVRVLLSDMRKKPIYELCIESGRCINTTSEHPYLVKSSKEGYILNAKGEITNNLPLNSDNLIFSNNFDKSEKVVSINGGIILNTTIPKWSLGGKSFLLRKCLSKVNIIRDSDFAILDNCLSIEPKGTFLTSYPRFINDSVISFGKFSSERNFNLFLGKNIFFFSDELGSICHNRENSGLCERWKIILKNFINADTCSEQFQNLPDHDSCSFESGSSAADFTVSDNVIINFYSHNITTDEEYLKVSDAENKLIKRGYD